MINRLLASFRRPKAWILGAALASTLLPGCDMDGYPAGMPYPPRTDALVIGKPERDAPAIDLPGEFPKILFANLSGAEKDKLLLDVDKVLPAQRNELDEILVNLFGTPANPKVSSSSTDLQPLVDSLKTGLKLDDATLARGSQLYRQQCLHCHGVTGDGHGSTGPWVNPHPRDYRRGVFKFTSSKQDEGRRKPRREDLVRTIFEGIDGSSMPSFRVLGTEDIDALAAYVVHLSVRGELEYSILQAAFKKELDGGVKGGVNDYMGVIVKNWVDAQNSMIQPDTFPPVEMTDEQKTASVKNGFRLFTQQGGAGCISCHTDFGRQSPYKYDVWGTITKPIDVTTGIYRGGRRPIDLFWRVHSGINGSGMTAFGSQLSSKEIWDIVQFLEALPYPAMRQKYDIKLESN